MSESSTQGSQAATYRVAFIGLGVMGYPMAGHLMKSGHDVAVFNRSADKAERWVDAFGGSSFATPKLAAAGCDFVCVCVGNDDDVRQVVLGADGALAGMQAGSVLIDHTTASAELARELDQLASEQGIHFLDAVNHPSVHIAEHVFMNPVIGCVAVEGHIQARRVKKFVILTSHAHGGDRVGHTMTNEHLQVANGIRTKKGTIHSGHATVKRNHPGKGRAIGHGQSVSLA